MQKLITFLELGKDGTWFVVLIIVLLLIAVVLLALLASFVVYYIKSEKIEREYLKKRDSIISRLGRFDFNINCNSVPIEQAVENIGELFNKLNEIQKV